MTIPSLNQLLSVRLDVTNKTSDYSFKEANHKAVLALKNSSRHGALVECHSDVWTKFPVKSTISRRSPAQYPAPRSIMFVASGALDRFERRFRQMIRKFEQNTQKPTGDSLKLINVISMLHEDARDYDHFQEATVYPTGRWLVELICLIPLHLAVATGNRFVPLKDGIVSADFERDLLGADIFQIAERCV